MKRNIKTNLLVILTLCVILLSGCRQYSTILGNAPSEDKVIEAVKKACPTEQFEFDSKETTRTTPMEVTYHFHSTERDLKFDAVSSVSNLAFFREGDTPIYYKKIEVKYADAVVNSYRDDAFYATLNEVGGTSIFFHDPSEFDQMARDLVRVSDIYSPEKQYNTEEWMKEHPLHHEIAAVWVSDPANQKESEKVIMAHIEINGCITYEEVMDILQTEYDSKVSAGEIPQ